MGRIKSALWVLAGLMCAIGSLGWYSRMVYGHAQVGYGNIVVWGLWVAAYIFFIGLSAGAFLLSSLVYAFDVKRFEPIGRVFLYTALVTLVLALVAMAADLGHMGRAWHALMYANVKSPLAWMAYLCCLYAAVVALELWFVLRVDFVRRAHDGGLHAGFYRLMACGSVDASHDRAVRDGRIVKMLATVGVPTAIVFHGGVGALFGTVASRPLWYSGLLSILFLLSALVSGGALLVVVAAIFQDGVRRHSQLILDLGRLVMVLVALDALVQASEFLVAFRGGIPGHTADPWLVLDGPFKGVFGIGQVLLGTVVPLALLALPTRRHPWVVVLACALVVVGNLEPRLNLVIPGLAVEEIRGLTAAVSTPRMTVNYVPTIWEWLLTINIVGVGMLLFGLGERLLPQVRRDED